MVCKLKSLLLTLREKLYNVLNKQTFTSSAIWSTSSCGELSRHNSSLSSAWSWHLQDTALKLLPSLHQPHRLANAPADGQHNKMVCFIIHSLTEQNTLTLWLCHQRQQLSCTAAGCFCSSWGGAVGQTWRSSPAVKKYMQINAKMFF